MLRAPSTIPAATLKPSLSLWTLFLLLSASQMVCPPSHTDISKAHQRALAIAGAITASFPSQHRFHHALGVPFVRLWIALLISYLFKNIIILLYFSFMSVVEPSVSELFFMLKFVIKGHKLAKSVALSIFSVFWTFL